MHPRCASVNAVGRLLVPVELMLGHTGRAPILLSLSAGSIVATRVPEDAIGVDDERLAVRAEIRIPAAVLVEDSGQGIGKPARLLVRELELDRRPGRGLIR